MSATRVHLLLRCALLERICMNARYMWMHHTLPSSTRENSVNGGTQLLRPGPSTGEFLFQQIFTHFLTLKCVVQHILPKSPLDVVCLRLGNWEGSSIWSTSFYCSNYLNDPTCGILNLEKGVPIRTEWTELIVEIEKSFSPKTTMKQYPGSEWRWW